MTTGEIAARLVAQLDAESEVRLPRWAGLDPSDLARAFLVMFPDAWPGAAIVDRIPEQPVPSAWYVCHVSDLPAARRALATGYVGKLLIIDDHLVQPPSERGAARATLLARLFPGVRDPRLRTARAQILELCEAGETFGIQGQEAELLVRWAHVMLANTALMWIHLAAEVATAPRDRWLAVMWDERSDGIERWLRSRLRQQPLDAVAFGPSTAFDVSRPSHPAFSPIMGRSPALAQVLGRAARAATQDIPCLIVGETGVGKEGLAQAIHDASGRTGPFVAVDTSSRAAELVASDLFGHERGAFSGAVRDRVGVFRQADGGTLFLDEVENLALSAQQALLRVLETKQVQPIGSDRLIPVDVRIVAATNEDPHKLVAEGRLRADLLYRLAGVRLDLPPLRQRTEDIEILAHHFAATEAGGGRPFRFSPAALGALRAWPWPGNIRELRNVIRAASIDAEDVILPQHLGVVGDAATPRPPLIVVTSSGELPEDLRTVRLDAGSVLPPPTEPVRSPEHDPSRRVWRVSADEAGALAAFITQYSQRGGSFTSAVERFAAAVAKDLPELSHYLQSSRPGQSMVRLFEVPDNAHLCRAALEALEAGAGVDAVHDPLPQRLRAALEVVRKALEIHRP